jgi:MinD-like ATPase involved in chromosome partitioning or flagellar assembly
VNERGLVEVPENAVRDEPIAFGLTAVQLGICASAVLVAAILNLLPIWEPIRLVLALVGAGPIALAAALPVRGEPAYRWIVRAIRHRRGRRVWQAKLLEPDKPEISGDGHAADTQRQADRPVDRESDLFPSESITAEDAVGETVSDARGAREREQMQERRPRLRVLLGGDERTSEPPLDERASAPVPHLLGQLHVVCLLSFAGGVGKTTLSVEAASLVGSRARYRTLDGEERPVRVLLLDAARTSPAAHLRLGLDPAQVSRLLTRYDWPDALTFEKRAVATRFGVTLLSLPQLPLQGLGPELAFGPIEAAGILDAAEQAGFQLVVVDLGTQLEDGHRHLIGQADVVLGVVSPRVEALPDVLRITSYIRALGAGRKLGLVANVASDEGSLPTLADGEQVPIVATVPRLPAFDAAGDRGVPAWTDDPDAEHVLRPLATAAWPLFPGVPSSSDLRFGGVVSTVRRLLRARGGRS